MIQQKTSSISGEVIDTISSFLASPPEGTPAEIIEAFNALGSHQYLPPKVFLQAVEQAPIAISITDPAARILYVNQAFEELTGYERDEVVGKNESMLSSQSTPMEVYQSLWETIQDRRVWQGTLVNHRKSKEEYLAELVIAPVLNPQKQVAYFLGMHRDISEVHRLEQRLKFQVGLTEAALDAAPMVMTMIGANREVLMDNHAYKALMGDFRGEEPAKLFLDALSSRSVSVSAMSVRLERVSPMWRSDSIRRAQSLLAGSPAPACGWRNSMRRRRTISNARTRPVAACCSSPTR